MFRWVCPASQVQGSVASFASAYSLGPQESGAAINLLRNIPVSVKECLTHLVQFLCWLSKFSFTPNHLFWVFFWFISLPASQFIVRFIEVRKHTMPKFINHDCIADGLLNLSHQTASGFLLPWKQQLTNTQPLVDLLLSRMELDWLNVMPKSRKAWNSASLAPWLGIRQFCSKQTWDQSLILWPPFLSFSYRQIMTPIFWAPGTTPAILWWIPSLFGSILGFGPQRVFGQMLAWNPQSDSLLVIVGGLLKTIPSGLDIIFQFDSRLPLLHVPNPVWISQI